MKLIGWPFAADPTPAPTPAVDIDRLKEKALRLEAIYADVDVKLKRWNTRMAEAFPRDIGIYIEHPDKIGKYGRNLTWSCSEGLRLGSFEITKYEEKQVAVTMLGELEALIEAEVDRRLAGADGGGLSLTDDTTGAVSTADATGALSEVDD